MNVYTNVVSDISIIIVSHNGKKLLKNCLNSIFQNRGSLTVEIIVVDNASTDGSVEMIKRKFPKVKLILNKKNYFYSKANNQGLKQAHGKYALILNPDTILGKNTLSTMFKFMEKNPNCGISTARQITKSGETLLTSHKFPTPLNEILEFPITRLILPKSKVIEEFRYRGWDRIDTREVDTIPGAFMFARLSTLKKVKFFDEKMPLFFSDADLSKRVNELGLKNYHIGRVMFTHLKAKTVERFPLFEITRQSYKDMAYYYKKHHGPIWAGLLLILSYVNLPYFIYADFKKNG